MSFFPIAFYLIRSCLQLFHDIVQINIMSEDLLEHLRYPWFYMTSIFFCWSHDTLSPAHLWSVKGSPLPPLNRILISWTDKLPTYDLVLYYSAIEFWILIGQNPKCLLVFYNSTTLTVVLDVFQRITVHFWWICCLLQIKELKHS